MHDEGSRGTFVEDLLLTSSFLVKGVVEGKTQRLSRVLEHGVNPFISVRNAVKTDLQRGDTARFPQLLLNLDQLVLAHEYVDFSRDDFYRGGGEREQVMIQALVTGPTTITLTGHASRRDLETSYENRRFMVIERPRIGLDPLSPDVDGGIFEELPYLILNRARITCFYGVTPEGVEGEGPTP
jgi:hypothetical protein